jgi:AraC-like DNA-binding protein
MDTDYFHYLPENQLCASWGCTVTALGRSCISSGSPYPPQRHPDGHQFIWENGRVLDAFQCVYISHGRGVFESASTRGPQALEAGHLFVIFPGVWHRYAPDPAVGWTESWLECRGSAFTAAQANGVIDPTKPIRTANADHLTVFDQVHAWAERGPLAYQSVLSTLGLQLLSLLWSDPAHTALSPESMLMQRAMLHILENSHRPLNMPEIARELKIGYTRFRELFQAHAQTSPKQYHLKIRMERARELLRNTDQPLKEIALRLGFRTAFHFSHQFQTHHRLAPSVWRRQARHPVQTESTHR